MDQKFPNSSPYSQPSWLSWQWRMRVSPIPDAPIPRTNIVTISANGLASDVGEDIPDQTLPPSQI